MDKQKTVTLTDLLSGKIKDFSTVTFEDGVKCLEELVSKVEGGSLPLEDAINSYEKGIALSNHLRSLLTRADERLKLLKKDGTQEEVEA